MISLNFTFLVQLALFLIFLWGTNRLVFRPLLRAMDAREEKVEGDRTAAAAATAEAQRLDTQYTERITTAHQEAAQRLHKARYDAYQEDRAALDALKARAEEEVDAYRAGIQEQLAVERAKLPALLPGISDAMDHQVNVEGSLL